MANPSSGDYNKSNMNVPPPYPAGTGGPGLPQYGTAGVAYQQQPGVTVHPHMPTQTVIISSTSCTVGPDPCAVQCASCNQQVISVVEYENGTLTWLSIGGLCLFGCWLGCCLIPTCVNDLKDVLHTCPNCKNFLGRYRRLH